MTERVYYTSDATDGRAQIIACTAEVDGRYAIELDRTLFHPQGGGQPADRGWIAGQVVETVIVRGDSVLHILSQALPLGDVEMKIDASARQLHARLHSAGHLLGLAGEQLGWQPVKAHHWPGEGRITFTSRNNAALPDASALLAPVKAWQAQDLPRQVTFADGLRRGLRRTARLSLRWHPRRPSGGAGRHCYQSDKDEEGAAGGQLYPRHKAFCSTESIMFPQHFNAGRSSLPDLVHLIS